MIEFKIIGYIRNIETIASGHGVYIRNYLDRTYGKGRWRKMKGLANIQFVDKTKCKVEIHLYEAHGIGRKDFKIKKYIQ